jgi:L,D-transpeptidase catalytic domain
MRYRLQPDFFAALGERVPTLLGLRSLCLKSQFDKKFDQNRYRSFSDPRGTTLGAGKAVRYGIGVGREGFTWSGIETISRKSEWPDWIPPAEMIARQPYLPRWVGGGPGNPLGARALYLGNTAYRIHGTNDPHSIGKHVSSGCIRLRDADVIDLYDRVGISTKVIVLPNDQRNVAVNDGHYVSSEGGSRVAMAARISVKPAAAALADPSWLRAVWSDNPGPVGLY